MLNYLDTEEELYPLDDPEAQKPRLRPFTPPPLPRPSPAELSAPPPIPESQVPTGDLNVRNLMVGGGTPLPAAPITPVEKVRGEAVAANKRVADMQAAAPPVPKPKIWQRLAAGAVGAAAGYSNASGLNRQPINTSGAEELILAPGYRQKVAQHQQDIGGAQAQAAAKQDELKGLETAGKFESDQASAKATREHTEAQTAAIPGNEVMGAVQHGGEVIPDGQGPPIGREGTLMHVGGKTVFLPSAAQKEKDKKLADQSTWRELPSNVAQELGLPSGFKVPPAEVDSYLRIYEKKSTDPNLKFESHVDEVTGDVTTIGRDVRTGALKFQDVNKSIARKRPQVTNFMNSPEGEETLKRVAQGLANGDFTRIRDIASLRGDQRIRLYDMVKQMNPKFNTSEIDRRIKMQDAIDNGQDGKNLQSFGQFLEHAGDAVTAFKGIENTNAALLNKSINWFRAQAKSSPEYRNLLAAIEPVKKEFETFLLNNRALYVEDRKSADAILNEDLPLKDALEAIRTMGHAAQARFTELNYRYKRLMGKDIDDPFSPEAVAGAQKIGINLTGGSPAPVTQPEPNGGGRGSTGVANGMITVQIPGQPPGQIPASAKEQFMKDHPNAVVK